MNNRGIRSFGALFIVLLFLMGAWAVHPVGSAQAQGKKIQGIVQEDRNPTAPISATVTLTDVHSLATYNDTTAGDQHTFDFTPSPGFYSLKVHATGYFDNGTTDTFRFDGTQLLTFIFNMTKWDTRNKTLTVLVTEATGANWDEYPYFPRFTVGVENAVVNYSDTPTPRTTLKNKPLVRLGNLWWRDLNKGGGQMAIPPSEYSPIDQWAGTVGISNTTILSALTGTPPERRGQYFLNFTQYVYTYTVAQLNHTPVIPGSYTVYKNGVPWMSRENADWKIDVNVGTVTILGNFIWGTDTLNMTWTSTGAIRGATVSIYNTTRNELITSATTDMFGNAQFAIWPGTWNVSASNTDHETKFQTSVYIGDTKTIRIMLPRSVKVIGFVTDSNSWIKSGVAAFLYNIDPSTPIERKVLKASVDAPQFTFKAYPGTFKLIVDANGYASRISDLTIRPSQNVSLGIITLDFSKEEKVDTAMIFAKSNWNNLTIYRNYSFNRDSIIPGLNPSDLRDAFLQIDYTLGNRNGVLDVPTEIDLFKSWWLNNGPATVDTTGLLATNSLVYLSNRTNGSAPAKADTEFIVNTDSSATYPIIIRDKAYYYARDIPPTIPWLKPLYYLNFTGAWDTNVTTYHNNTYVIDLPHGYQMTDTNYKSPGLDIKNFTRMDLDPGLGTGTAPRAEMVVKISLNATARGRVKAPAGFYQELNSSKDNYTATVMAAYNITYSADQSYDPVGKIADANYTWTFGSNANFGIDTTYNFTAPGFFMVILTMRSAGLNVSTTHLNITVDAYRPLPHLWTNLSVGGTGAYADNTTIRVNQSIPMRFDAVRSTDQTYSGKAGTIASAHWDFDGNGIEDGVPPPGLIVNHSFDKPGTYTLHMWVFDAVGHRSGNASMTIIVNDTAPPSPDFKVLDSSGNTVSTLTEGVTYNFNASLTTDNYDSIANLTYTWDFGDGSTNITNQTGLVGYNVTHMYSTFNNSYTVKLNVSDTGFLGNKANYKVLERKIVVQVDTAKRPNVAIKTGSFTADPGNPEEGVTVTITVKVTNDANRGRANNVGIQFYVRSGSDYKLVDVSPEFLDANGNVVNNSLAAAETKTVRFTWKADAAGSRDVLVKASDPNEPYTWLSDNSIESNISVKEAGWKLPAIIIGVAFLIIGVPILYYLGKRWRAGELSFRRKKGEGEEKESKKEKPEKEEKEKKRL